MYAIRSYYECTRARWSAECTRCDAQCACTTHASRATRAFPHIRGGPLSTLNVPNNSERWNVNGPPSE
uniref:Uncharacterized protein n=1 Tax=Globodera pallida TaxID=36090 RepID=A0A183CRR9_GLOPA